MNTAALHRTQIYLGTEQQSALATMARSVGSSSSALIRQAIDGFLAQRQPDGLRAKRLAAAGAWQDAPALDLEALRREERVF